MQLTDEQIQQLFNFTEKHYVKYYDIQIELVDHLASRIEEEMEQNQNLPFDSALEKVYKGFGYNGFAEIVQQKEKEMRKHYNIMRWQEFKSYFTIPRIILTILITLSTIFINVLLGNKKTYLCFLIIVYGISLILIIKDRNFKKKNGKPLLMLKANRAFSYSIGIFVVNILNVVNFSVQLFADESKKIYNYDYVMYPFIVILTLFILCSYSINIKIKEKAITQFPEAFAA